MTAPTEVKVPDIGDFGAVPIIEVHVSAGDQVNAEDPLVTLESDKATMDIPAPVGGTVAEVLVKVGDEVSEGSPDPAAHPRRRRGQHPAVTGGTAGARTRLGPGGGPRAGAARPRPRRPAAGGVDTPRRGTRRALACGAPPGSWASTWPRSPPTGPKGRITKDDLLGFLKGPAQPAAAAAPARGSRRSPRRTSPRSGPSTPRRCRGSRRSPGPFLHRSWLNVPHVTHNDEADITDLDALPQGTRHRRQGRQRPLPGHAARVPGQGLRRRPARSSPSSTPRCPRRRTRSSSSTTTTSASPWTPPAAWWSRWSRTPTARASWNCPGSSCPSPPRPATASSGRRTWPVARSPSPASAASAAPASPPSSTPPKSPSSASSARKLSPVWNGTEFTARNMLPLSLSYDHRVIDGALAARFARHLCYLLEDDRRLLL